MKKIFFIFVVIPVLFSCSKDENGVLEDIKPGIPPELGYFSPSEGRVGTYVVIEGYNFSTNLAENELYFNNMRGTLYEANDSVLVAIVPEGATTGKLKIIVGGLSDTTSRDFTVSDNPWLRKDGLGGRNEAIAFSIGDVGYCGLGNTVSTYFNDFWKYNIVYNKWEKIGDFAGPTRDRAIAFSVGSNGYVGLGYNDNGIGTYHGDFWEYTPESDSWKQLTDFPGGARRNAISFGCNGKGFVGLGMGEVNNYRDFWMYDPSNDSWTALAGYPGDGVGNTVGFVIGNSIYIGCGSASVSYSDFWRYDIASNTWTAIANFAGGTRVDAVGFGLNGYGYVGTGSVDTYRDGLKDFWKYDPSSDSWIQVTDYYGGYVAFGGEDGTRSEAVAFTLGNYAYVGTGQGNMHTSSDIWEYKPE